MDKTKQIGKKVPLFALLAVLILTMTNQPVQAAAVGDSTTGDTQAVVSFKAGSCRPRPPWTSANMKFPLPYRSTPPKVLAIPCVSAIYAVAARAGA